MIIREREKSINWLEEVLTFINDNDEGINVVNKTTSELSYLDTIVVPESFNMLKSNIDRYSDFFGFNSPSIFFDKINKLSKEVNMIVDIKNDYNPAVIEFILDKEYENDVIYTKHVIETLYSGLHVLLEIENIDDEEIMLVWSMFTNDSDKTGLVLSQEINMSVISAILSVLYTRRGGSSSNLRQLIPFLDEMMISSMLSDKSLSKYILRLISERDILDLVDEYVRVVNERMREISDNKLALKETPAMYLGLMLTYLISITYKPINQSILLLVDDRYEHTICTFFVPYDELIEEYANYLYLVVGENPYKVLLLNTDSPSTEYIGKPKFKYTRTRSNNKSIGSVEPNALLCKVYDDLCEWIWCASGEVDHGISSVVKYYHTSSNKSRKLATTRDSESDNGVFEFRKHVKKDTSKVNSSRFESIFGEECEERRSSSRRKFSGFFDDEDDDIPQSSCRPFGKQYNKGEARSSQYVTVYIYDVHMRCFVSINDTPGIIIKIENPRNSVTDINTTIQSMMDTSVILALREYSTHALGNSVYLVYTNNNVMSPFVKGLKQHKTSVVETLQISESSTKLFKDDAIFKIITK